MSCKGTEPLAFPITDVQILPDNSESLTKGIPAGVGTPRQNIVFLPWPELNNTWIYDERPYCDASIIFNDVICQVRRGNLYSGANSSSFRKVEDIPSAGGAPVETQGKGAELGIDTLLTSSLAVQDGLDIGAVEVSGTFPFGVPRLSWDHGYTISHAMGLGSNSTLLNTLVRTGRISSRVWSIFWGRMWVGPEDAVDGSLVLGGYDERKVIGKNYTQPLDFSDATGCWTGMKVHISSVRLNFRTGEDVELLPPNSAVDSCVVPQRQLLFEGPHFIIDAFEDVTGMYSVGRSFGLHWSSYLFESNEDVDIFDGDMTISLSSGLNVRIPNNQYLVPYVTVDRSGTRVFNTSQREFLFNDVYDNPSTLGRYFLTGAYLMVNHDAGTFTMWAANPVREHTLVSVGSTDAGTNCDNSTQPGSSSDGSNTSASATLSAGRIAGVVIGAVAAFVIIGAGMYFFYARRRERSKVSDTTNPSNASPGEKDASGAPEQPHHHDVSYELHDGVVPELAGDEGPSGDVPKK
ncbi:putative peptidase aspartic [Rosellinia necatrix]|uniref:Putative peptidase aspartic n=1 Tax=Rosellinia necatrix TaxID=77044 RepID=A0A1W2TAV4_ROSNE|nr:putative peptidase aspartic [Rosellinia necatrix]